MSDIFISYSRNDRERVRVMADALERHGFSVWWDPEIPPGESFSQVIDRQLKAASCIIAVWSESSIQSNWVQEEADDGMASNRLIPVMIDNIDLPRGFKRLQTADLIDWSGDESDPNWQLILSQVHKLISAKREKDAARQRAAARSRTPQRPAQAQQRSAQPQAQRRPAPPPQPAEEKKGGGAMLPLLLGAVLLIGGGAGYYFFSTSGDKTDAPSRVETAAVEPEAPEAAQPVEEETPAVEETALAEVSGDAVEDLPVADDAEEAVEVTEEPAEEIAEMAPAIAPGETFRDCDACPEMVALPAGAFQMGAADGEHGAIRDEQPAVNVEIAAPFALSKFEVTFDEWNACVADGGCNGHEPSSMNWGGGSRPVINVSYEDAVRYTEWLSEKTGETYRLPSEAEWEYGARAGSGGPFAFGETITTGQANFDGQYPYPGAPTQGGRGRTVSVGSYSANAFGLHDMSGNVWEWTSDCWRQNHASAPTDGSAVGGACSSRVKKGGSWRSGAWRVRSAHRREDSQSRRRDDIGFRVARDIE